MRERVDVSGNELVALHGEDVKAAALLFQEQDVEAVAISYLWSFLDPSHEQRTAEILRDELPGVFVTMSHEVLPQIRAYERHSTTALNAFVGPKLQNYLANIKRQLADRGFGGTLLIVQSNGGVMSPEIASEMAVNALMSGPAAAPEAALQYARRHGSEDVITVDMGGTSFDVALVRGGEPLLTSDSEIGGYRVALPMLDIHTVGAGGGSLVWVDSGGILRVGPQSATATPGPACYGRGGENPTTTDADLLMGYLNPDLFGDGAFTLDVEAARKAVEDKVARPLGLSVPEAVEGIYRVVNATMAEAVTLSTWGHWGNQVTPETAIGDFPRLRAEFPEASVRTPSPDPSMCAEPVPAMRWWWTCWNLYRQPMDSTSWWRTLADAGSCATVFLMG